MSSAKIYTKTGDSGLTSLVGGQRVAKSNERIKLYGLVDELNSFVGLARAEILNCHINISFSYLEKVQNLLFNIGSNLACLPEDRLKMMLPQVTDNDVLEIEKHIDQIQSVLSPLRNFILPGGGKLSAALHVCRTITRKLEVSSIEFNELNENDVSQVILQYFNRLSDYFFVLARVANNEEKKTDIIWSK